MRIVDGGLPAPTFWSFVLSHDNFKPSGAARALIHNNTGLNNNNYYNKPIFKPPTGS